MNQILQGARLMVKSGVAHMHLELHPPELGRLRLALVVEGEMVTARFTAESQTVRAIIETNLPELSFRPAKIRSTGGSVAGGGGNRRRFAERRLWAVFTGGFFTRTGAPGADGLEMAFFSETGDEESIREEAAWLGRINLRV